MAQTTRFTFEHFGEATHNNNKKTHDRITNIHPSCVQNFSNESGHTVEQQSVGLSVFSFALVRVFENIRTSLNSKFEVQTL